MRVDPSGYLWKEIWDWCNTLWGTVSNVTAKVIVVTIAIETAMVQGRWDDLAHDWENGSFNPFNQSEKVALDSKVISFYKGSLVVRQNILDGYFSIGGTVFLNSNTSYSSDDLNHEWGHSIQERILGKRYFANIAIPSVLNYHFGSGPYYSKPWERTADWFGGVNRGNYVDGSLGWGIAYFILGPFVLVPYYLTD